MQRFDNGFVLGQEIHPAQWQHEAINAFKQSWYRKAAQAYRELFTSLSESYSEAFILFEEELVQPESITLIRRSHNFAQLVNHWLVSVNMAADNSMEVFPGVEDLRASFMTFYHPATNTTFGKVFCSNNQESLKKAVLKVPGTEKMSYNSVSKENVEFSDILEYFTDESSAVQGMSFDSTALINSLKTDFYTREHVFSKKSVRYLVLSEQGQRPASEYMRYHR